MVTKRERIHPFSYPEPASPLISGRLSNKQIWQLNPSLFQNGLLAFVQAILFYNLMPCSDRFDMRFIIQCFLSRRPDLELRFSSKHYPGSLFFPPPGNEVIRRGELTRFAGLQKTVWCDIIYSFRALFVLHRVEVESEPLWSENDRLLRDLIPTMKQQQCKKKRDILFTLKKVCKLYAPWA